MKLKYKFTQRHSGEWEPVRHKINVACCDCGLGHLYKFRVRNGALEWAVWRSPELTRQSRRRRVHKFVRRRK